MNYVIALFVEGGGDEVIFIKVVVRFRTLVCASKV